VEGRPLINLSLAINYALGGYDVWGYHALNLTVHILAGLTLLGIERRTLLQPALRKHFGVVASELALAVAVLWTVHPLQTESVTYIIQRAESIMGLFYLLTMYCFIRGTESKRTGPWYSSCVAACAMGMASKEVMVSAPLMVLLYDRAFLSLSFRNAWRQRWPLYLGLASTWIVLGYLEISAGIFGYASITTKHVTRWQYLATEPGVILYYLRLSVWPSPLSLEHNWPIATTWVRILPPAVVVVSLLAASAWAWRRNAVWGFVGTWFFFILAPSSSFVPILDPLYEHRMYLSLAAVISLVVVGLYSLLGRQSRTVFAVAAIGLGFLTWQRNQDYCWNPEYNLGVALGRAGRTQEAISHFEQALRITPNDAWTHYNLGLALHQVGRVPEAIAQYEQAVRLKPDLAEAHNNLGIALKSVDKVSEAIEHYREALRLKPDYAEAHNNLALALLRFDKVQEAIEHWEEAVRLRPDYAEAHNNFGSALLGVGKVPEAIEQFEQALRSKPNYAKAYYNLGTALEGAGRVPEAIGQYEQALRINPDFAEAEARLQRLRAGH
jgi:protein O-mannosyl-transferase